MSLIPGQGTEITYALQFGGKKMPLLKACYEDQMRYMHVKCPIWYLLINMVPIIIIIY